MLDAATAVLTAAKHPPGTAPTRKQHPAPPAGAKPGSGSGEDGWEDWSDEEERPVDRQSTSSGTGVDQGSTQSTLAVPPPPAWWLKQRDACVAVAQQVLAVKGLVKAARLLTKCGYPVTVASLQQRGVAELQEVLATLLGRALRWVVCMGAVSKLR
jgi:hypothetical protein